MVKVTRIPLICQTNYLDGTDVNYKDVNKILWTLQDQTRAIKNKTIQLAWEWNGFSSDYKAKYGVYPNQKDILNYVFSGYAYDKLKAESDMNTANLTATIRAAEAQFKANVKDYIKGAKSIMEYKSNQPLELHNKAISLEYSENSFVFKLGLCNKAFAKQNNIGTQMTFRAIVKDKSQKVILERCIDGRI